MKQGRASSNSYDPKTEPNSHAVSVSAVEQMGASQGVPSPPLYQGRGFEAPKAGLTVHKCGSQGRHE